MAEVTKRPRLKYDDSNETDKMVLDWIEAVGWRYPTEVLKKALEEAAAKHNSSRTQEETV